MALHHRLSAMARQGIQTLALRGGVSIYRRMSVASVRALLARLHPVDTGVPLFRCGRESDGGYLVPDDLEGVIACFSPGVDDVASFEEAMVARKVPCYLADASVEAPPFAHDLIEFDARFLGVVNDATTTTLDHWVASKPGAGLAGDLLLQMDIEGHEWSVLLNASDEVLGRFRIVVLELHGLHHIFDKQAFQLIDACLDRLGRMFHVVHAHPNNASGALRFGGLEIPHLLEVTLLRRDRAEAKGAAGPFPHPLDRPNIPGLPDLALPACLTGGLG